jgi:GTPase
MEKISKDFKAGYVAVVGQPNVGKSTLTNKILKYQLSITTPKPQTTRHRILGIHSGDNYQMIFLDTPGIIEPGYLLQKVMMKASQNAIRDADVILFLVEASLKPSNNDLDILENLKLAQKPIVMAINKIDLVDRKIVLPLIDAYQKLFEFSDILPISAKKETSLDILEKALLKNIPLGFPFYPVEDVTDHPERFFVSEIIRGKIFQKYGDEIPYSTAVVVDEFVEKKGRKDFIKARIIVERDSQKAIMIGKGGKALKMVGQLARTDIEEFLGRPVFLELWVAVKEKWRKKDLFLKEFGYEK